MSKLVTDLANLVADADFQKLGSLQNQPNLFRAVGRTFTETWHSAFLAWLLNPAASHALGSFPLQRFLTSTARSQWRPESAAFEVGFLSPARLAMFAATRELSEARVLPNDIHPEKSIAGAGRVDGWIEVDGTEGGPEDDSLPPFRLIIEMKINSKKRDNQCVDYGDYLEKEASVSGAQAEVVAVFIAPQDAIGESSRSGTDDHRWYCLDFQLLHDDVLIPCLEHPGLSPHMKPLIEHYLLNLRSPRGTEGRMAFTKEEKELARKIHARHLETFRALADILAEDEEFPEEIGQPPGMEQTGEAARTLHVAGTVLAGKNVGEFLTNAIEFIWKSGLELPAVPFNAGPSRYLIAESPNHPDGRPMAGSPRQLKTPQGNVVFLDSKHNWPNAVDQAEKLLRAAGFEAVRPLAK